jgi:hypothetical protein
MHVMASQRHGGGRAAEASSGYLLNSYGPMGMVYTCTKLVVQVC